MNRKSAFARLVVCLPLFFSLSFAQQRGPRVELAGDRDALRPVAVAADGESGMADTVAATALPRVVRYNGAIADAAANGTV